MPLKQMANGNVVCGVCHCSSNNYPKKTFYCPSCISFKLLKYNLNKINLLNVNSIATHDINSVLNACFGDNVTQFLTKYANDYDKERKDDKLEGTNVSIESVARLAFMLMNVDLLKKQEHIKSIGQLVEEKRKQSEKLEARIRMLKEKKKNKQRLISLYRQRVEEEMTTELQSIIEVKRLLGTGIVTQQNEYITIQQKRKLYDLALLWNIRIINGTKLTILYTPILPISFLVRHSMDLILNSFMKSCELVEAFARMLGTDVPYRINTIRNDFAIGDFVYELKNKRNVFELSHIQILKLSMGVARVILNVVVLLRRVDVTYQFEHITPKDLLSYDMLLVRLIERIAGDEGFKELSWRIRRFEEREVVHQSGKPPLDKKPRAGRKSSLWGNWFRSNTEETQFQHTEEKQQKPVERYSIADIQEYESVLNGSKVTERIPEDVSERSKTSAMRPPVATRDGNELVHDERKLAEEIYRSLVKQMQDFRDESSLKDPLAQNHLREAKTMKHESQMWVLT